MAEDAPRAPRGRGAAILEALRKKQKEKEDRVGAQTEEPQAQPTRAMGRAAMLLKVLQDRKVGVPPDKVQEARKSSGDERSSRDVQALTERVAAVSIEEPKQAAFYRGESGKPIDLMSNYIKLDIVKGKGVYEYEVKLEPEFDSNSRRISMVNRAIGAAHPAKVFDGGHQLYLPEKVTDTRKTYKGTLPEGAGEGSVTIIFKKQKSLGDRDCLHLYQVLFKRIMHVLLYSPIGKNYFDTEHRYIIPQHKLEVYPGFAVSVDEREEGLMLCLDTQHKVIRSQTVYELLVELKCAFDARVFKENVLKRLLGACIYTRYNNRTYIVHDVLWDMTPKDTFTTNDGRSISFVQYYKTQHSIEIVDHDQPLLLHRRSVRVAGSLEKEDRMVCLVPELCHLTGMEDSMRNDFKLMKDVAFHTRVTPQQRLLAMRKYIENVRGNEKARSILANWGLSIAEDNLGVKGRQLDTEMIIFGEGNVKPAGPACDWNRELGNNPMIGPVDIRNWIVFHTPQDARIANDFAGHMVRLASTMGCIVSHPRIERLPNDQTQTYANFIPSKITKDIQVVVFVCPTIRNDRYCVIKKLCCGQLGVASQVINSRTLSRPDKIRAIVLKIALQINCKLGGSLWTVKFPFRGWMICGIDAYHGSPSNSVCGFVSNLNETMSQWFSLAVFQTKELGDFYKMAFTKALQHYKNACGSYPSKVIIIRDGVGDGQLEQCLRYELEQFNKVLEAFEFTTTVTFVVVQKRINTKIFCRGRGGEVENPPPGTLLDHSITRKYLYDFFLVPQNVRQGTVNPVHYIVLYDAAQLKPDHLQRLCYKLCHLYYNWSGTIKVPAPCQYAHKLAAMVGQVLKGQPVSEFFDRLWYL